MLRDAKPNGAMTATLRRASLIVRLGRFVLERFPPQAYGPLIVALVVCGATAASLAAGRQDGQGWDAVVAALAVGAAFLQLRILDEIRDEGTDRIGRPDRPLPAGLVTVPELHAFAAVLAFLGVALATSRGATASAWYGLALLTIWILGSDLRRRMPIPLGVLGDALAHSVIAPELLVFVWAATAGPSGGSALAASIVLVWGAALAIETGRKTMLPSEERTGVETYSKAFGRPRAVVLVAASVSVAWLGAGTLAVALRASSATALVPFAAAALIPLLALGVGDRIGTGALRTASVVLVLAVLLWPLAIARGIP